MSQKKYDQFPGTASENAINMLHISTSKCDGDHISKDFSSRKVTETKNCHSGVGIVFTGMSEGGKNSRIR